MTEELQKKLDQKDWIMGQLIGELVWLTKMPTLSSDMIRNRVIIEVTQEETDEQERLKNEWLASYRDGDGNRSDEYDRDKWTVYQTYYRYLLDKYLPKEIKFHTWMAIEDNDMFRKGLIQSLWDSDGCHYSLDNEDIKIEQNPDFGSSMSTYVIFIYKEEPIHY